MATWRKVLVSGSAAVLSSVTSDAAVTAGTSFVIGSADINETDLEKIDGITNGAGAANKALVLDGNADVASGVRNITITGTLSDGNYTFDTSGNVSGLGTVGSGNITSTGTVQGTTITATTAFVPDASDGAALGTTALEFSDLYLADGAVLSLGDGGADVTFTHVADTGVLLNSTNRIQFNDSSQYIGASSAADLDIAATTDVNIDATTLDVNAALDVSGNTALNGDVDLGDATGDTITATGRFDSDIVPSTDSARDLGTSALQFAEAHIDTGYIDSLTTTTNVDIDDSGGDGAMDGVVIGAATAVAGTFTTLNTTGLTTIGDASGDTLTINAATINPANIAAGTDNTVVVYNGSTLVTDEIDSRVWGSTLLDGSNGTDNEIGIFTDSDTIEGDSNFTFDGSTFTVTGNAVVTSHISSSANITGSAIYASSGFYGDGSNLTGVAQDIDSLTELAATPHATQDEYLISDNGTEKRISVTNAANGGFALVSGDILIAAGGAATIQANSVALTT
ncbi:uncharacterized protein METZ01_LOCUS169070, partial [marine metagenome]